MSELYRMNFRCIVAVAMLGLFAMSSLADS